MLCFKFVNRGWLSPGGFGKLDYSGPWPKKIEVVADPRDRGQCAAGIHVVPLVEEPDFTNVVFSYRIVMLEVDESDIVYSDGNGKMRCRKATVLGEPSAEELAQIKEAMLVRPSYALQYAMLIQQGPCDETRKAVLTCPIHTFQYALFVDQGPRDDTRAAVLCDPASAFDYAQDIDKGPRDDTRSAVLPSARYSHLYAKWVDRCVRDDTRESASRDRYYQTLYREIK